MGYYRVQQISASRNELILREHKASTIKNKEEEFIVKFNKDFEDYNLKLHKVNAIGIAP